MNRNIGSETLRDSITETPPSAKFGIGMAAVVVGIFFAGIGSKLFTGVSILDHLDGIQS